MSVLDVMKKRCSVRDYLDTPVSREKLLQVLDAARIAPSACNNQPWHFIVVENQELKDRIGNPWARTAPAIIVACGDHSKSWRRSDGKDHCDIDLGIAVDHMTLAAADLGLGTCWVCSFNVPACAEALDLPEHLEPVALLPIGYPASHGDPERHARTRKALDKIVSWDGYQGRRK